MKKKIVSLALAVCLLAIAAVGTLAYFTDKDAETNVFTTGNVDIDLQEDFAQNSKLMPGSKTVNNVKKVVDVKNVGSEDAFVRVHIAIPTILDDGNPNFDASKNVLHFNADAESYVSGKWNWGKTVTENRTSFVGSGDSWNFYKTTIGGVQYNVYVVTYETALAKNEVAAGAMSQVYLDEKVTNADMTQILETLNNNIDIKVIAEGCQAAGFNDAFTALDTAFGTPGSYNAFA